MDQLAQFAVPAGVALLLEGVEPTVLDQVSPAMTIAREEVFGPVTAIIEAADEREAVAIANDTQYGLAAQVWSASADRALRVADALDFGTVSVNAFGYDRIYVPYEGHKQSGTGEDKGPEAIRTFTQLKVTTLGYDATLRGAES